MTAFRSALALAIAVIGWVSSPAFSQSHLEPAPEAGTDFYRDLLRTVFGEGRREHMLAQAIIIPSFTEERSVSIRQGANGFDILVLRPRDRFWRYALAESYRRGDTRWVNLAPEEARREQAREIAELMRGLPADPRGIRLERCEAELDNVTGRLVLSAWAAMLAHVREATSEERDAVSEILLDGTSYLFWRSSDSRDEEGGIYAPLGGSTADLANLSGALVEYCDGRTGSGTLRRLARAVIRQKE